METGRMPVLHNNISSYPDLMIFSLHPGGASAILGLNNSL
jgi:hypothetical protein